MPKYIPPALRATGNVTTTVVSSTPPSSTTPSTTTTTTNPQPTVFVMAPDVNTSASSEHLTQKRRCPGCYYPQSHNNCPDQYPTKDERPNIFDWRFGGRGAPEKIRTSLAVRRLASNKHPLSPQDMHAGQYEFFFSSDKQKLYDDKGNTYSPPSSYQVTSISVPDHLSQLQPDDTFLDILRRKVEMNVVHGHCTVTSPVEDLTTALLREYQLKWYLRQKGHKLVDIVDVPNEPFQVDQASIKGPDITIRFQKQLVDFHNMDNSAMFLFGETSAMQAMARKLTSQLVEKQRNGTDLASAVIALPLLSVLKKDDELLADLKSIAAQDAIVNGLLTDKFDSNKFKIDSHLKLNLMPGIQADGSWTKEDFLPQDQKFMPWKNTQGWLLPMEEVSVLIAIWNYPDVATFGVTGGKRSLGETSLDCAIRENHEEILLDMQYAHVLNLLDEDTTLSTALPVELGPWHLCMRLQIAVNNFIYLHESMINRQ